MTEWNEMDDCGTLEGGKGGSAPSEFISLRTIHQEIKELKRSLAELRLDLKPMLQKYKIPSSRSKGGFW